VQLKRWKERETELVFHQASPGPAVHCTHARRRPRSTQPTQSCTYLHTRQYTMSATTLVSVAASVAGGSASARSERKSTAPQRLGFGWRRGAAQGVVRAQASSEPATESAAPVVAPAHLRTTITPVPAEIMADGRDALSHLRPTRVHESHENPAGTSYENNVKCGGLLAPSPVVLLLSSQRLYPSAYTTRERRCRGHLTRRGAGP
jgi:hypothetical protein